MDLENVIKINQQDVTLQRRKKITVWVKVNFLRKPNGRGKGETMFGYLIAGCEASDIYFCQLDHMYFT